MWKWRRRSDDDFAEEIHAHIAHETKRLVEEKGMSVKDARTQAILLVWKRDEDAREVLPVPAHHVARGHAARRGVCAEKLPAQSGLRRHCHRDARPRHRRQHGDLQCRQFGAAVAPPVQRSRLACSNPITNVPAESPNSQPRRRTLIHYDWLSSSPLRQGSKSLSHVGYLSGPALMTFTGRDVTVRLEGLRVESPIVQMLGVPPLLGRLFDAHDDQPGADRPPLQLCHMALGVWRRPEHSGLPVDVYDTAYAVIGVMPASFGFPTPQKRNSGR